MGVSGHRSVVEEVMKCVNDWGGRVRKCLKCCAANSKKISHTCIMERCMFVLAIAPISFDIRYSIKENSEMEKLGIELNGKMMMMFYDY